MNTFRKNRVVSLLAAMAIAGTGLAVAAPASAEDTGPGFSRPLFNPTSNFRLWPTSEPRRVGLGAPRGYSDSLRSLPWRSFFGEVQGFPPDMPLLFTVAVTGNTGATLSIDLPNPATDNGRVANMAPAGAEPLVVTLTPGLSSWEDATELAFTGTQPAINSALGRLFFRTIPSAGEVKLKYVVTRDEGAAYNVKNNHFYKFINWDSGLSPDYVARGADRTWTKALADAAKFTHKGVTGHLATITSEQENNFVRDRLGEARNVFLAGSDKDREGQWKWYAGPENGQVFWEAGCAADDTCGTGQYIDSTPAVNTYSNWAISATDPENLNNEPNNYPNVGLPPEDYLVANRFVANLATGQTQDPRWNDYPEYVNTIGLGSIGGFVVEFSGNVEDFSGVYTREITLNSSPQIYSLTAKRTSSTSVDVRGLLIGYAAPWKVELQRRSGKEKFKTIKQLTPRLGITAPFRYVDKLPAGNTFRSYDYRVVLSPTGLPQPLISQSANIPIESKDTRISTKLAFIVGEHVKGFKSSLFKGVGLKPKSKFKVTLRSEPVVLVDTTAGSDGSISALAVIPETIEPGKHSVTIEGTAANGKPIKTVARFTLDDDLIVTEVSDSSNPETIQAADELPATGSTSNQLSVLAALLVAVGGALSLVRRRISSKSVI